ncbi:MAG: hypothetical protein M5R40_24040 [Anaerolineae bacterium]|nr:hypothetical protein [Anaerolineae bacterium]
MIELAVGGKRDLVLANPAMPAAGVFGFGDEYARLVAIDKLGALVTNPITWTPRAPASGPRVVAMTGGMLLHTGLPNPGMSRAIRQYRDVWAAFPAPVIVHVVATNLSDVHRCCAALDTLEGVAGIELGVHDQATAAEVADALREAARATTLPVIARLPLLRAPELAPAAQDAGACARWLWARRRADDARPRHRAVRRRPAVWAVDQPLALRAVGQAASQVRLPVIGCGGIHAREDARDFIDAGAVAVQVDAAIWVKPGILEEIAGELGGLDATRVAGAWPDEW